MHGYGITHGYGIAQRHDLAITIYDPRSFVYDIHTSSHIGSVRAVFPFYQHSIYASALAKLGVIVFNSIIVRL